MTPDTQNMTAYQSGKNVYYKTIVDIGPDTELLVWYGDDYARELGLISIVFTTSLDFRQLSKQFNYVDTTSSYVDCTVLSLT